MGKLADIRISADRFFELSQRSSNMRTEILAGLSMFLALSYIVVVNPTILAGAGIEWRAAFFATALVAGLATVIMGLWARLPFALAPGMEMNAYVAFFVVGTLGFSWPEALGVVFWSGVAFVLASVTGIREKVLLSIPPRMKAGLSLSVGVFIAMIAAKISGILVFQDLTVIGMGNVLSADAMALFAGLLIILFIAWRKLSGGVLVSVIAISIAYAALGMAPAPGAALSYEGDMLSALGMLQPEIILNPAAWSAILVLFLVDFFGSVAKLVGLSAHTSLQTDEGLPRIKQALVTDSSATVAGAILGTSNITVYVESGVGIAAGGRTGITAIVCGICLLGCLALGPLVQYVPVAATTGALAYVAISLFPTRADLQSMDWFEIFVLIAMQLTVLVTAAIDKALFVGVLAYLMQSISKRQAPNPYLAGSAAILAAGYVAQAMFGRS
jgi:adenine/guanine/hypoxanthine permease